MLSPKNTPLEKLSPLLQEATIADNGRLTKSHTGLEELLPKKATNTYNDKKTVLLLGSGMVAAPLVEHLAKRKDTNIVIGKITMNVDTKLLFYTNLKKKKKLAMY